MTDFGGHVQLSRTPALSQNANRRTGGSFSEAFEGKETYTEFTAVCPKRNADNPDIFPLCKHTLSCSAYAGASCTCSISSRSAKPQQTCFSKRPAFHTAGEGCAGQAVGRAPVEASISALTKPPDRRVINQGLVFARHKGSVPEWPWSSGSCCCPQLCRWDVLSEPCRPQGSTAIPVHAACHLLCPAN